MLLVSSLLGGKGSLESLDTVFRAPDEQVKGSPTVVMPCKRQLSSVYLSLLHCLKLRESKAGYTH